MKPILLLLLASAMVTARAAQPNVVILYADDLGFGDLGIQNPGSKIPTPNLDRLAREGTRFTDAHSSSGVCTPSRYALLQGRYHWRKFHGIVNSFEPPVLDEEKTTLAELLKGRGYNTACFGKWHLGWDWEAIRRPGAVAADAPKNGRIVKGGGGFPPDAFDWSRPIPGGPLSHGFDEYFGDDVPNFPPYAWFQNDRVITPPTVPLATPEATAEGHWEARPGPSVKDWDFHAVMPTLTGKAEDWIQRQSRDKPFFLYFPFTSPHAPIVPTPDFVGKSSAGGYGDFVVQTDEAVGRVLRALETGGFTDNTLVIFSSDNGPEHYAYERVRNSGHRSMGPLRGVKRDLHEGGHRVPLLVRWPGVVPASRVSDALVSQIDLFATIAAAVGAEIPAGSAEDSFNQLPLLRGESGSARETLVHNTNPDGYALRHRNWVLIAAKTGSISKVPDWFREANGYKENNLPGELYDLQADPGQRNNLYATEPGRVRELTALLDQIRARSQVRPAN